jgi:glycosyltransferase involved in cell wall biosynthesis
MAVVPRISVITATLNRGAMLRRAIESVLAQGPDGVEHIIVDGVSRDGTLEMLREYPHLTVISEPDRGVYDAWNKGLRRASGELICILNSDDEIPPGAFAQARATLSMYPNLDLISGAAELCRQDADGRARRFLVDDARILDLREQNVGPGTPLPNARYLHRKLVKRIGFFDDRCSLVADRDYFLRVVVSKALNITIAAPLYRYHYHDQSLTFAGPKVARGLSLECLQASRTGFVEAGSDALRLAYANWHAWAALYMSAFEARSGQFGAAARVIREAFATDAAWPLRLPGPIIRHVRERQSRLGREIGQD